MRAIESIEQFRRDRHGAVGMVTTLLLMTLLTAAGVAVDLSRTVQFRTALQNAVDAAALAGATVYTTPAETAAAVAVATTYMNSVLASLPSNNGVTFATATAAPANGYTVTVTASGPVPTTIMAALTSNVAVSASATALNPIVQVNVDMSGTAASFYSSAADANTIYWYHVPADGSVPTPAQILPEQQMFTNGANSPGQLNFPASSTQTIGFALKNVTGGNSPYGPNAYGATQGSTHWFFSQTPNLSQSVYANASAGNCSLQTAVVNQKNSPTAAPKNGSCAPTAPPYSTPTCSELSNPKVLQSGQAMRYFWNDMGGAGRDDFDYNDAEYNITCSVPSGGQTLPPSVVLIK